MRARYIVGSIAGLTEKSGGMQDIIQRRLLDFQDYLDEKIPAKLVAPDVHIFLFHFGVQSASQEETKRHLEMTSV